MYSNPDDYDRVATLLMSNLQQSLQNQIPELQPQPQLAAATVRGCVLLLAEIMGLAEDATDPGMGHQTSDMQQLAQSLTSALLEQLADEFSDEDVASVQVTLANRSTDDGQVTDPRALDAGHCPSQAASDSVQPALLGCLPVAGVALQPNCISLYLQLEQTTADAAEHSTLSAAQVTAPVDYRVIAFTDSSRVVADVRGAWWPETASTGDNIRAVRWGQLLRIECTMALCTYLLMRMQTHSA